MRSSATQKQAINAVSRAKHRRERLRYIIAPVGGAAIALVLILLGVVILAAPAQINVAATCMSALILTPLVLVCLVPYAIFILAFFALSRVYGRTSSLLDRTRLVIHRVNRVVYRLAVLIATPVIRFNQAFAWIEHVVTRKPARAVSDLSSRTTLALPEKGTTDER